MIRARKSVLKPAGKGLIQRTIAKPGARGCQGERGLAFEAPFPLVKNKMLC